MPEKKYLVLSIKGTRIARRVVLYSELEDLIDSIEGNEDLAESEETLKWLAESEPGQYSSLEGVFIIHAHPDAVKCPACDETYLIQATGYMYCYSTKCDYRIDTPEAIQ